MIGISLNGWTAYLYEVMLKVLKRDHHLLIAAALLWWENRWEKQVVTMVCITARTCPYSCPPITWLSADTRPEDDKAGLSVGCGSIKM